jgi:hypothetical protein
MHQCWNDLHTSSVLDPAAVVMYGFSFLNHIHAIEVERLDLSLFAEHSAYRNLKKKLALIGFSLVKILSRKAGLVI